MVFSPAPTAPSLAGFGVWINQPVARGRLSLRSTDPAVDPEIDLCLAQAGADRTRLHGGLDVARDVLADERFAHLLAGPAVSVDGTAFADVLALDDAAFDAWLDGTVDVASHPSCTCPIGDPSDGGVVDGEGRVHGTERLRVIDLSITPSVPRANTNLTAIMVGEHLAARLRLAEC